MAPSPFRGWRGPVRPTGQPSGGEEEAWSWMGKRPQVQLGEGQPAITTRGTKNEKNLSFEILLHIKYEVTNSKRNIV